MATGTTLFGQDENDDLLHLFRRGPLVNTYASASRRATNRRSTSVKATRSCIIGTNILSRLCSRPGNDAALPVYYVCSLILACRRLYIVRATGLLRARFAMVLERRHLGLDARLGTASRLCSLENDVRRTVAHFGLVTEKRRRARIRPRPSFASGHWCRFGNNRSSFRGGSSYPNVPSISSDPGPAISDRREGHSYT